MSEASFRELKNACRKLFREKNANFATSLSSLKATVNAHDDQVKHLIAFIEGSQCGETWSSPFSGGHQDQQDHRLIIATRPDEQSPEFQPQTQHTVFTH